MQDDMMAAPGDEAAVQPRVLARLSQWLSRRIVHRSVALMLAGAALAAGTATFAAFRGVPPIGGDPNLVLALLTLDLVLLLLLASMMGWRLVAIWAERRRGSPGSRLHVRLVRLFGIVSVVPAIIMALFSVLLFNFGIEAWLSERVRTTLNESVAVAEAYLQEHKQNIKSDVLAMGRDLGLDAAIFHDRPQLLEQAINFQAALRDLSEAVIFEASGRVLARSGLTYVLEFEPIPNDALEAARAGEVAILTSKHEDRVRALVRLDNMMDSYLYVGRYVDPQVLRHMERARGGLEGFEKLEGERAGLQIGFAALYVVIAMLLLLAAGWVGINVASGLSEPLGTLISATEKVRAGDLGVRVPEDGAPDEIGTLSRAFNRMTNDLASNRQELLQANRQLDERRRFTETVLTGVSAGVIGLDAQGNIDLPNRSASELLGIDLERAKGQPLATVVPEIGGLIPAALNARRSRAYEQQIGYQRGSENCSLLVRIAVERDGGTVIGYVVTFDDVTELMSAQRKAAWADVARRIAHEIKNPLTPIQLSAERIKRKYLREIASDPETFVICTDTIVKHVGDIGRMVDEFSSFARMPAPTIRVENLNELCRQQVFLQRSAHVKIEFATDLPSTPVFVRCDGRQIAQTVTNLLQNAVDAIVGREGEDLPLGRIELRLSHAEDRTTIAILDNGRGLPKEGRERLTEPYFTTRQKGTGLGLAIVKKIMEDHGGELVMEDRPGGGAAVSLILSGPLADPASEAGQGTAA
ncbi:MAG: ATP-binding protein [Alphaproteobacteria bacterium]